MKYWQWGVAIAFGIRTLAGYAQDHPWGRIGAEQIEAVFLRNDEAAVIEGLDVSLDIRATEGSSANLPMLVLRYEGDAVLSANADGSLSLLSPNDGKGIFYFGDGDNSRVGRIVYDHSVDQLKFMAGGEHYTLTLFGSGGMSVEGDLMADAGTLCVNATLNRVGLGTESPSSRLHVLTSGGEDQCAVFESDDANAYIVLKDSGGSNIIGNTGNHLTIGGGSGTVSLRTNWVDRLRVDTEGRVGICTTSPGKALDVHGEMVQDFGGASDYGVPGMRDEDGQPKPVIYHGVCSGGSVDYSDAGFPADFKSGCVPSIVLTPVNLDLEGTSSQKYFYYWDIVSPDASGFTYRLLRNTWNTSTEVFEQMNEDVSESFDVHWQAMGWVE
jgi:hypothetical protein